MRRRRCRCRGVITASLPRAPSNHGSGRPKLQWSWAASLPRSRDLANFVAGTLATLPPGPPVGVAGARAGQTRFSGQLSRPIFRANFSGQFFRPTFWEPARIVKQQVPSLAAAPSPAHRAGPPCQAALAPPIPAARALPPGGSAVGERAQIAFTRPETPSRSSMLGRYARARRRRPGMGYQRERIAAVADAPMPFLARSPWALSAAKNNQKNRVPSAADVGSELTRPTPAWRVRRVYQRPRQP
jgi:hypothetical protein